MIPPQSHNILSGVKKPNKYDVLIGRGSVVNNHLGNHFFRYLIVRSEKINCKGKFVDKKSYVAKSIVARVRSLGGRFLEKDRSCGLWFESGDKRAIEKTQRSFCGVTRGRKSMIRRRKELNPEMTAILDALVKQTDLFFKSEQDESLIGNERILPLSAISAESPDLIPSITNFHQVEEKESSLEYLELLQTQKHLYIDEFKFLNSIFGMQTKTEVI